MVFVHMRQLSVTAFYRICFIPMTAVFIPMQIWAVLLVTMVAVVATYQCRPSTFCKMCLVAVGAVLVPTLAVAIAYASIVLCLMMVNLVPLVWHLIQAALVLLLTAAAAYASVVLCWIVVALALLLPSLHPCLPFANVLWGLFLIWFSRSSIGFSLAQKQQTCNQLCKQEVGLMLITTAVAVVFVLLGHTVHALMPSWPILEPFLPLANMFCIIALLVHVIYRPGTKHSALTRKVQVRRLMLRRNKHYLWMYLP
jgi:hypothetical protein